MAGTEILKDEPTATCGAYVSISLRPAVGNPSYAKRYGQIRNRMVYRSGPSLLFRSGRTSLQLPTEERRSGSGRRP